MKFFDTKTYTKLVVLGTNNKPVEIIVHHSGGTDANPLLDTSNHTAKVMEDWHLQNGWDGLGYHYVIHKDGSIWRGRPEHRNGAHTKGMNTKSIGICLAGNFDATLPSAKQKIELTKLIKDIMSRHPITGVYPHREYAVKSCFGNKLADSWAWDLVKKEVKENVDNEKAELVMCEAELVKSNSFIQVLIKLLTTLFKSRK